MAGLDLGVLPIGDWSILITLSSFSIPLISLCFPGVSARHIAKIEKGQINPSYEVLATLKKRLGFSGETLFHPELEQDDEINQFIGKYLACSERDRKILIKTLNCLANELLCKTDTSEVDTEDTK